MSTLIKDKENENSVLLRQTNSIIVEIIKKELRASWPTALSDLSKACYSDQQLCKNILRIFSELSEEIFEYWKTSMTSEEVK